MRHLPALPNEIIESILDLINIDDITDKFLLYAIFGTNYPAAAITTRNSILRFLTRFTSRNIELLNILLATNTIIGGWNVINYFNPGVYNGEAAWELHCDNAYYNAVMLILLLENIGFEFSTSSSCNYVPYCNESTVLNYRTYNVITGYIDYGYRRNIVRIMYSNKVCQSINCINTSLTSATRCYISGYGAVSYDYHFTKIGKVNRIQDYSIPRLTTGRVSSRVSNKLTEYISDQQVNIDASTLTSVDGTYMYSEIRTMNSTNYRLQVRRLSDPYSFTIQINNSIYSNNYTNYICTLKSSNINRGVWTVDPYGSVSNINIVDTQYYSELECQVAAKLLLHYDRSYVNSIRSRLSEIISDEEQRHWINKWIGKLSKTQSQAMLQYIEKLYT